MMELILFTLIGSSIILSFAKDEKLQIVKISDRNNK